MSDTNRTRLHYSAADGSFHFHHGRDERPNPAHFKPHYEQGYEIYMFISGEGSFTIEGNRYELEPYSILMINSNELHVLNISEEYPYERVVLTINESVLPPFMLNGVDFFRSLKFRRPGHGSQLTAETVRSAGLLEHIVKLEELLAAPSPENEFVAKCLIVQLLSAMNRIAETDIPKTFRRPSYKIGEVLEYINANLEKSMPLEELAERFYITKYHLCHSFKEATGFSIHQYMMYKRIRLADTLMLEGYTPTQACFMSGFNGYSNFYKSYRKLTGRSPRSGKTK